MRNGLQAILKISTDTTLKVGKLSCWLDNSIQNKSRKSTEVNNMSYIIYNVIFCNEIATFCQNQNYIYF